MQVIIKRAGQKENEFYFRSGPIYIGRQIGSQIFLPDRAVSRQHAVLFTDKNQNWFLEDLDSPNKTYLNERAIHKTHVKPGDIVRIGAFCLEIDIDQTIRREVSIHLDDTIANEDKDQIQSTIRNMQKMDGCRLSLTGERLNDLRCIFQAGILAQNEDDLCKRIVRLLIQQMNSMNVWIAVLDQQGKDIVYQYGQSVNTQKINFDDIVFKEQIHQAINDNVSVMVPKVPASMYASGIKSAVIVPVLKDRNTLAILYADRSRSHEGFEVGDLDFMILLSTIISSRLEGFKI